MDTAKIVVDSQIIFLMKNPESVIIARKYNKIFLLFLNSFIEKKVREIFLTFLN
jgi:hypothetical protein